jgi:hypothetical protein
MIKKFSLCSFIYSFKIIRIIKENKIISENSKYRVGFKDDLNKSIFSMLQIFKSLFFFDINLSIYIFLIEKIFEIQSTLISLYRIRKL